MRRRDVEAPMADGEHLSRQVSTPLIIATVAREKGITGVHTHFRQLCQYLEATGRPATLVTAFSWGGPLIWPVFGLRLLFLLERCSGPANVWWYRHWHEAFLYQALRRRLAALDDCVIYAQCPLAARAAMRARRGSHQRVVMAVHSRISQADEWADKGQISRRGRTFRAIRAFEREVIPRVDGLVYVSRWAQEALTGWLPSAATVPSAIIDNFVAPIETKPRTQPIGDLVTVGNLESVKNHRYLLRILAEAKRAGFIYTLDVFGQGPLKQELQQQAKSLGLEGLVRLHGFRTDVRDFLPGYRAYVHASYSESSSFAIIEAMAASLPIVAGDMGPLSELFDEGVEGFFWPLDDPASAATVLIGLMEDEAKRSMAADAAFARFRRDFDAEVIAPRLLSFVMGELG